MGGEADDTIWGDGDVGSDYEFGIADLTGGDDRLGGGAGDDVIFGDGGATASGEESDASLEGGDDRIVGGVGSDTLWGDGKAVSEMGEADLLGGADTFVVRRGYGRNRIEDFRQDDGDTIELAGTRLVWGNLDTNGSGDLDDADRWVAVDGTDIAIDIGRPAARPGTSTC